jgi:hypothetical protein
MDLAFAHERVETEINAPLALPAVAFHYGSQRLLKGGRQRREVSVHQRLSVVQRVAN